MKSLNIQLLNSDYYETFTYPAGETQARLTPAGALAAFGASEVNITARISSPKDIIELGLVRSIFEDTKVNLILPYLPYSRADRKFVNGDCLGLGVFGGIISSFKFNAIKTWDVHNNNLARFWIDDLQDIDPYAAIHRVIKKLTEGQIDKHLVILFPDAGAVTRYRLPQELVGPQDKIKLTHLSCTKKRDPETGKFLGFDVPNPAAFPSNTPVLIIDDICDGGGTFNGIAEALWETTTLELNLYVTHGIFSKGTEELFSNYQRIFTTNSFDQAKNKGVEVITYE